MELCSNLTDILERTPPTFDQKIKYGPDPHQFAELRRPKGKGPFPLLFFIHGGFWQSVYDLSHAGHLCADLTRNGIMTCNVEYRRIGDSGGGWPGTFQDVSRALDSILELFSQDHNHDLNRVVVMGHSAGGHLALWLVGRHRVEKSSPLYSEHPHRVAKAISLAGVCDLRLGWKQRLGHGIITNLMGGSPDLYPDRYESGNPIELLPTGAQHILIHGIDDEVVPISQSDLFAARANALGDHVELHRLERVGHFELIDPESSAWSSFEGAVLSVLKSKSPI